MNLAQKYYFRRYWRPIAFAVAFAVIGGVSLLFSFAASTNSTVDFTQPITTLADKPFSSTISTYGQANQWATVNAKHKTDLANLKAGYYRIPLGFRQGVVMSAARGNHNATTGDTWISTIKDFGGTPEIVIGGDNTQPNSDVGFTPDDAANMVRHFNKPASGAANPVHLWVIGNEPDVSHMSIQTYCTLFNDSATKMKAVDPTIQVVGPAWAFFSASTLTTFLQCAGNNVDVLDWHHYAQGSSYLSNAVALSQTNTWENEVSQARQLIQKIVPARASQIQIQVGEYNWSWRTNNGYPGWQGEDRFYQAVDTVWVTSVAAHVARAGARANYYADLGGGGGLAIDSQTTATHFNRQVLDLMPSYYGLEMLTGGNLFRGFGTSMVAANTTLNNVEIYASNNGKNIVMINKDPSNAQDASIALTGFGGGAADVWQTDQNAPFNAPVHKATLTNITSTVGYTLPPYSVTTFVLNDGSVTPPPPSTPKYSCDSFTALQTSAQAYTFTTRTTATNGASVSGYTYNFGDGSAAATSQAATAQHTYKPGVYTASVTVNFNVNGQIIPVSGQACSTSITVAQPAPVPTPTPLTAPARINVGGGQYKDPGGNSWQADVDYVQGTADSSAAGRTISGTTMAPLYQDERVGNFSYHLPIANGTYVVRLHFAEISNSCKNAGCRVFNVSANGSPWLTNFDIAAKVGANAADVEEKTLAVTQNALDLTFSGVTGVPQLAAIEVLLPSTPAPAPGSEIVGIKNKCLDNRHGSAVNGNKIDLYTCNGSLAQKWTILSGGTIVNANGYCLDVKNGSSKSGTNVQLYQCNNTASQVWKVNTNGTIVNVHSGLCLDDKHSRTKDGNQIWIYGCNGSKAQKWTVK